MLAIGQAARAAGVTTDTVRYYDKNGLLLGVKRDESGNRLFDAEALAWLRAVVALRESGMSVAEIARVAALQEGDPSTAPFRSQVLFEAQHRLQQKAAALQGHIEALAPFL